MKKLVIALIIAMSVMTASAKTLIVYYSYTNNVHTIVNDLKDQIGADVLRIEPAEEGLDYAANNYAIGSALIAAIRENPNNASAYPEIKPANVNLDEYNMVIVAAPLWWSNMAAPLQTFLFHNGAKMAGKKIGLIVSSYSSGISSVEADAKRLIPAGDFLAPSLWIKSQQTSSCHSMLSDWLKQIDYSTIASGISSVVSEQQPNIRITEGAIYIDGAFNSLALYNIAGSKMLETSHDIINTSTLASGVYVARINTNAKSESKKIIIRH